MYYTTCIIQMDKNTLYQANLLSIWEETYKKGQLTFWLLLSLRDNKLYINEIQDFIKTTTKGTISCENQSLYRALRKHYDLEIVDYELKEGSKGPNRKYYFLTEIGKGLLQQFIERNISLFYDKKITEILNNKSS